MFAKRLDELTERKRLIVIEADLHRSLAELECAALWVRFNSAFTSARARSLWLKIGGTMAGLLAARRWLGLGHWIPTVLVMWRWIQRLK